MLVSRTETACRYKNWHLHDCSGVQIAKRLDSREDIVGLIESPSRR